MRSFQDSHRADALAGEAATRTRCSGDKVPGVHRPDDGAELHPRSRPAICPTICKPLLGPLNRYAPWLVGEGGVEIGPIPAGMPVNLIANLDLHAGRR